MHDKIQHTEFGLGLGLRTFFLLFSVRVVVSKK